MKSQGRIAYEIFNQSLDVRGATKFTRLPARVQLAWEDAAKAVSTLTDPESVQCQKTCSKV